jgi:polysaccharide biosynthesis protein PslH
MIVTGTVDDVRPYLDEAAVYVVPLRAGSGTRMKIFEARGMAKPVV